MGLHSGGFQRVVDATKAHAGFVHVTGDPFGHLREMRGPIPGRRDAARRSRRTTGRLALTATARRTVRCVGSARLSPRLARTRLPHGGQQVFLPAALGRQAQAICYTTKEHRASVEAFLKKSENKN